MVWKPSLEKQKSDTNCEAVNLMVIETQIERTQIVTARDRKEMENVKIGLRYDFDFLDLLKSKRRDEFQECGVEE